MQLILEFCVSLIDQFYIFVATPVFGMRRMSCIIFLFPFKPLWITHCPVIYIHVHTAMTKKLSMTVFVNQKKAKVGASPSGRSTEHAQFCWTLASAWEPCFCHYQISTLYLGLSHPSLPKGPKRERLYKPRNKLKIWILYLEFSVSLIINLLQFVLQIH